MGQEGRRQDKHVLVFQFHLLQPIDRELLQWQLYIQRFTKIIPTVLTRKLIVVESLLVSSKGAPEEGNHRQGNVGKILNDHLLEGVIVVIHVHDLSTNPEVPATVLLPWIPFGQKMVTIPDLPRKHKHTKLHLLPLGKKEIVSEMLTVRKNQSHLGFGQLEEQKAMNYPFVSALSLIHI